MHHMEENKLIMVDEDSETDCDIPSDFNICPCKEELEKLPEVVLFIKRLQNYIRKQQSKLNRIRRKLREFKLQRSKLQDAAIQTDTEEDVEATSAWGGKQKELEKLSIADQVKEAAQSAMQLTGFVYEETSGMYYDYNTGYYYNAELGLYYDGNSGTYYYYDDKNRTFQFHSQIEVAVPQAPPASSDMQQSSISTQQEKDQENKRKLKQREEESKKLKHDDGSTSEAESLEEGECSDSDAEEGGNSSDANSTHQMETNEEVSKGWPPGMRIIVQETNLEKLKVGTLFLVTCTGGTMGREGDHAISIPDINISKHHAKLTFDEGSGKYFMTDLGSRNGTYLNGKRLSVAKQESEPHEVVHGSVLQVGGTKLLCHIHTGRETCGHCEPGIVQNSSKTTDEEKTGSESKKDSHQKELRRIRRKFGLESSESVPVTPPGYEDRAQIRRATVGSQNPHEKTQTASLQDPIQSDNKGFKMMMKMGWNEGQALGKEEDGCVEPVPLVMRRDKTGLGSTSAEALPPEDPAAERKKEVWRKTQKRYQDIS